LKLKKLHKILPFALALIAVLIVMGIYWDTGTLWQNHYDDAFISYRYAANLAEGNGLVFNLGERTDAASSFLYTVILAGFYRIGMHDLEMVSFALNMLSVGLIASFVYLCAFKLSGNFKGSITLGLLAATHGFISGWAVLGMDIVPFAALLCILVWAILERRDTLSLILVCAIILMRLEGLLVVPFWWFASGRSVRKLSFVIGMVILFYFLRGMYYGTILPHSYLAKTIITYYKAAPMNILRTWKTFALIAPLMMIAGILTNRRLWWLGAYIILVGLTCLIGPCSDWVRYTVILLPLCIIAGSSLIRYPGVAFIICAVLTIQGYDSVKWMRHHGALLAPIQEVRRETGEWLQENADHTRPVISGDIGGIAYHAPDVMFIDTLGLTSREVLHAYQAGSDLSLILHATRPAYIADTFEIKGETVVYTHGDGAFVKGGKETTMPTGELIWGKRVSPILAIAIMKLGV